MVDGEASLLPDPPFDRAGRDGYRTPMQWDASPTAGFTSGTPWLPIVDGATRNVEEQRASDGSVLALIGCPTNGTVRTPFGLRTVQGARGR